MAISTSERIHLERLAIKKRQLVSGMATAAFAGQAAKEAGRGDYVQQVGTPARKLVLTNPTERYLTSSGIHSLKRRALTRKTIGRKSLTRRGTAAGPGGRGKIRATFRARDRSRGAQPSGARVGLGRPHSFTQARQQAARRYRTTKTARRGFKYEEQAAKFGFLGTRQLSDYRSAEIAKSRKPIVYQPY